jgi:hypothetical protein
MLSIVHAEIHISHRSALIGSPALVRGFWACGVRLYMYVKHYYQLML